MLSDSLIDVAVPPSYGSVRGVVGGGDPLLESNKLRDADLPICFAKINAKGKNLLPQHHFLASAGFIPVRRSHACRLRLFSRRCCFSLFLQRAICGDRRTRGRLPSSRFSSL